MEAKLGSSKTNCACHALEHERAVKTHLSIVVSCCVICSFRAFDDFNDFVVASWVSYGLELSIPLVEGLHGSRYAVQRPRRTKAGIAACAACGVALDMECPQEFHSFQLQ
jgi:hypothetical protein